MQTSITKWLTKPAAVTLPPTPPAPHINTPAAPPSQPDARHGPPTPPPAHGPPAQLDAPSAQLHAPAAERPQPDGGSHAPALPFAQALPPLPPAISLSPCLAPHLPGLKRLNTLLLPIPYPDKFYAEIASDPVAADLTLLALWCDTPHSAPRLVGAIRCRLLAEQPGDAHPLLYISTLGVLAPYRRYGVATHLLLTVLARAVRSHGCRAVGAHVWEANDEGRAWYRQRGFRETHLEDRYYRRLQPQGAWVVRRDVGVRDLMLGL